jgi:hypothetical protein
MLLPKILYDDEGDILFIMPGAAYRKS